MSVKKCHTLSFKLLFSNIDSNLLVRFMKCCLIFFNIRMVGCHYISTVRYAASVA